MDWALVKIISLSLLFPGGGQLYLKQNRGYVFASAEIASWIGYAFFKLEEKNLKYKSYTFASKYADADLTRRDEVYWDAVERYRNYEEYLEDLWRKARYFYPDDPLKQEEYVKQNLISGEWNWINDDKWFKFQDIRADMRRMGNFALITLGVMGLNRLISAIDAIVTYKALKKKNTKGVGFYIEPCEKGFSVCLYYKF